MSLHQNCFMVCHVFSNDQIILICFWDLDFGLWCMQALPINIFFLETVHRNYTN